jgi:hypothetical protein
MKTLKSFLTQQKQVSNNQTLKLQNYTFPKGPIQFYATEPFTYYSVHTIMKGEDGELYGIPMSFFVDTYWTENISGEIKDIYIKSVFGKDSFYLLTELIPRLIKMRQKCRRRIKRKTLTFKLTATEIQMSSKGRVFKGVIKRFIRVD